MRRPRSLAGRLFLAAAMWMALAMAAGGVVLAQAFRDSIERGFEQRLEAILRTVTAALEVSADGRVTAAPALAEPRFEQPYSGWYWQVSGEAGPLARSRSLWDFAFPAQAGTAGGPAHVRSDRGPRGEPVLVVERDLTVPQRSAPLHIIVAADRADIDHEVQRFRLLLTLALGGLGLGLLAAVAIQVHYGMRPLRRLAADLEGLRAGESARLRGDYPTEIQPLAEATNKVLDHDAALIARARTHVGNLAHALKTPLAVLKAESAARGGDAMLDAQVARMDRLVDYHLARARAIAAAGPSLTASSRVAGVVAELAAVMMKIHADKGLVVDHDVPAALTVAVDHDDLTEMVGNLLDNAGKYARCRIRVSTRLDHARLLLTIEDDGPGMSEADTARAARRGARLDESRPGWGLGLAIVSDLAGLNDGALLFGRSTLGGLAVTLALPMRGTLFSPAC